jgi:polyisoprenoid-binding protein YceI
LKYVLDPRQSRLTVQAFATGMLSGFAHNPTFAVRDFNGELSFSLESFEDASLLVTVRADSLELTDQVKEQDRKEILQTLNEQVLQAARYPEIAYRAAGFVGTRLADNWFRVRINGTLTLRGVTRPQAIDAQLRLLDGSAKLSGDFNLPQAPYGIKPVTALGGMIKVKDELKLAFDLTWIPADQTPA